MNCSQDVSKLKSSECTNIQPLPNERPDIKGVDSLGNVYNSNDKIVGWWINGTNKTIRAKMYDSGNEYSLEMNEKLHKSKEPKTKKSIFSNVVSKITSVIQKYY